MTGYGGDTIVSAYNFFYLYAILILFIMLMVYNERIIRPVRVCLIFTEAIIIAIMVYQGYLNINTFSGFTYVMPILVVLILLHSRPFDDKTGALGTDSFESFVNKAKANGVSVDYVALKLYLSAIEQMPDELGKVLNSFWHSSFKNAMLFSIASDYYILAIPREERNGNTEEKMNDLIDKLFPNYFEQYHFPYKIVKLYDADFVENLGDILGILKYLLQNTEENSAFEVDASVKENLKVYKKIRDNLTDIEAKQDLDDERVLVYCQPIRNMKTGKYDTAEALMRLEIPEVGLVMPAMFIDLAEQYNHIHTLSKIMLNKVCKNIKSFTDEGYDFNRISVNFAASEIKAEGFCDEILEIVREAAVSPARIGIELTETQSERDFQIVKRKIKTLRDAGMTLYLDDVGTGYSNLDRIVQYDVDVVKFDRFFLLEAEKSVKIVKMLKHLSQAFLDLDYKLLFEGVETETHESLCLDCGADYIQGFKYSKPVPIKQLREFFALAQEGTELVSDRAVFDPIVEEKRDFSFREVKDQYGILIMMSKLFYSMHIIDLVNNTAKPYNPTEDTKVVDVVNSSMGADEMMRQIMRMCTAEEHVEAVLAFSDLTTIADRMQGKQIFQSDQYIGRSIGWYVATFYTIEADELGRPTKVLYTTRSVKQ